MARERTICAAVKQWLKSQGWIIWKNEAAAFRESGLPNLMALKDGVFLAIKVKRPGYEPSALQSLWLRRINDAGGIGFYAISVRDAEAQLTRMLDERRIEDETDRNGGSDGSSGNEWSRGKRTRMGRDQAGPDSRSMDARKRPR